jgi:hypothetical protein
VAALVLGPAPTALAQTHAPERTEPGDCPGIDLAQLRAPSVFRYGLSAGELREYSGQTTGAVLPQASRRWSGRIGG